MVRGDRRASTARRVGRDRWRVAGPVHIAETREQARGDVKFGLADWLHYFQKVVALPGDARDRHARGVPRRHGRTPGVAVVGTPDDLIAQIERLEEQSGGFGAFLVDRARLGEPRGDAPQLRADRPLRDAALPGRHRPSARRSMEWVQANRMPFLGAATQGMMEAIQKDAAERSAKAANQ